MLSEMRLRVYINAYNVRLERGETLDAIDKDYLNLKRLTQEDVKKIHTYLS